MAITDPVADMLTRIRNANVVKHDFVELPSSKIKKTLADILLEEGYIAGVEEYMDGSVSMLKLNLKYSTAKDRVITGLKRISKPGLRVYTGKDSVPEVLGGLGIAVISTSHGVMTDRKARKLGVGGEVLCYVW